ncbi:MAG: hypothetical protein NTY48_02645 [Candidatus Diapherotrites archaeon]|nr:hypothetical protein [Candidatus Diapherotrites archaeon]
MVSPEKRRMQYKTKRTPSGSKREYFKGKHKKIKCAMTGKVLAGVPHETKTGMRSKSKTQKRPSVPFGGVLSAEAREEVFIEMGKVLAGIKEIDEVDERHRKYVKQVMKRAEVE